MSGGKHIVILMTGGISGLKIRNAESCRRVLIRSRFANTVFDKGAFGVRHEQMKKRSVYWWTFLISGLFWAIGVLPYIIILLMPYSECRLLYVYFPLSMLLSWFGSGVFLITLVVWLIPRRKMNILFLLL